MRSTLPACRARYSSRRLSHFLTVAQVAGSKSSTTESTNCLRRARQAKSRAALAGDCAARFGNPLREILGENKLALQLTSEEQEIEAGLEDDRAN